MGWHSECIYARNCPYGSETVPGTCGYTSCIREKHFKNVREEGDFGTLLMLESSGQISRREARELYVKYCM